MTLLLTLCPWRGFDSVSQRLWEPERFLSHMHSGASLLSRISSSCIHTCHKHWKTVADRRAHLFEHKHHRLLGLAENLPRSSCVSSRFQSECTYLFLGYFWSFSAFDCCVFTYASVINTPTHFSECCSGGFHAARTRARTAELNPGFNTIYTHTFPLAKMTIKSGLRYMCEDFSQNHSTLSSAQWKYCKSMTISVWTVCEHVLHSFL